MSCSVKRASVHSSRTSFLHCLRLQAVYVRRILWRDQAYVHVQVRKMLKSDVDDILYEDIINTLSLQKVRQ